MHITPSLAEVIAQVFPTLLLAILLEGRPSRTGPVSLTALRIMHVVRMVALVSGMAGTMIALTVAAGPMEGPAADWMLIIIGIILFAAFALMVGSLLGVDNHHVLLRSFENGEEEKRRRGI